MASLNLSTNGPSISKSYQTVVDAPPPTGPAATSATYGQWAVFSVAAPLANAFQDSGSKESVLKVQSSGEGELVDLIDEFSDGRIQFAFVKVKDANSGLPKSALIAWCGEGVPERTKGYFTSHMTAVAKLLHGYHVQITARSDRDLTPEGIIQKVADASGSKYSAGEAPPPVAAATKPVIANKPAFTPTSSSGYSIPSRAARKPQAEVDADGWGADAPEITRTQLEKVKPAYVPTKVNMRELSSQQTSSTQSGGEAQSQGFTPDVVGGSYQPIGKVDIAAIRRQAKESGALKDDRPDIVKGSYEPIGKVDIAAIRAKAQKPDGSSESVIPASTGYSQPSQASEEEPPSLAQRSAAFSSGSERLTSMPKPKVANKFGAASTFTGTKAPLPGGFGAGTVPSTAPVGLASKNFADQGGKTPAQIWAEKKARARGTSGSGSGLPASGYTGALPVTEQKSGSGGQWESGYTGKKWAAVNTTHTGQSAGSGGVQAQTTGDASPIQEEETAGVTSIRDRFAGAAPMGAPSSIDRASHAPELETSTKPNRGIPIPGLSSQEPAAPALPTPPVQPRSPTPETPEARDMSPVRIAIPVSNTNVTDVHEEQFSPPPALPTKAIAGAADQAEDDDEPERGPDPARAAAQTTAGNGSQDTFAAQRESGQGSRAKAEFDYEAAEGNEVSLREGEIVTDIQKIDPDWWYVTNADGQTGLVPSNYLVEIEDGEPVRVAQAAEPVPQAPSSMTAKGGPSAVAEFDYEAGEENELSFPEGATITDIEFPDDDWWFGHYRGQGGLFPAAYVKLQQ